MMVFSWRKITADVEGGSPELMHHTMNWHEGRLYVFGGFDGEKASNVLYVVEINSKGEAKWERIKGLGDVPEDREFHTATVAHGKIWVIGGALESREVINEVYAFDIAERHWKAVQPYGSRLEPRCQHTAEMVQDLEEILIFGGFDGALDEFYNDLLAFNVASNEFRVVQTDGKPPSPRSAHGASLVRGAMYIFGGGDKERYLNDIFLLQTSTMTWSQVEAAGDKPSPRHAVVMDAIEDNILVFGGDAGLTTMGDSFIFSTVEKTWTKLDTQAITPRSRSAAAVAGRTIYIHGGDGDNLFSDLFAWTL